MLVIFLERGTNCGIAAVWAGSLQIVAYMKCTGIFPLTHTHTHTQFSIRQAPFPCRLIIVPSTSSQLS